MTLTLSAEELETRNAVETGLRWCSGLIIMHEESRESIMG